MRERGTRDLTPGPDNGLVRLYGVDLSGLPPGEYELVIDVRDEVAVMRCRRVSRSPWRPDWAWRRNAKRLNCRLLLGLALRGAPAPVLPYPGCAKVVKPPAESSGHPAPRKPG